MLCVVVEENEAAVLVGANAGYVLCGAVGKGLMEGGGAGMAQRQCQPLNLGLYSGVGGG